MPVRIDQRVNAIVAGRIADGVDQGIRIGPKAAVNHERAVVTVHGDHIATGALEEFETAEIRRCDSWRRLRGTE